MIKIIKIEDEILSSSRYEIYVNKQFYAGNLTREGLKFWKKKLGINLCNIN